MNICQRVAVARDKIMDLCVFYGSLHVSKLNSSNSHSRHQTYCCILLGWVGHILGFAIHFPVLLVSKFAHYSTVYMQGDVTTVPAEPAMLLESLQCRGDRM